MRLLLLLCFTIAWSSLSAQGDVLNILNRDSFAPGVKKATLNCYLAVNGEQGEPQSSRYYECDSLGKWIVRIETFSDGDESYDSVKYNPVTRTRIISRTNDFEPSKTTTIYNSDGTVKSFLAEPGQRDAQLTQYEYDREKRVTKKTVIFVEHKTVEVYLYDELGRMLNLKRSSGSVTSKKLQLDYEEQYVYDGAASSMMYAFYYGANETIRVRDTTVCTYDDARRLISKVEVHENGAWSRLSTFTYDAQGRQIAEQWETRQQKDPQSVMGHRNTEYDSLGYYTIYEEENAGYNFSNTWITTYNQFGLPEQCIYQTSDQIFIYVWIYEFR